MTHWVGSISFEQQDNWQICKRESLFGSNTNAALKVRAGDELFIWGSRHGWLARCRATSDARPPRGVEEVPWPEPERYRALIAIEILDEPATPLSMSGPEIERTVGIGTVQLPQFPRIDVRRADHLTVLLSEGYRPHVSVASEREPRRETASAEDPRLRALDDLKVDRQLGRPAPYQQLVLLWAISEAVRGGDRLRPFSSVSDELRALLAPFAVSESAPDPELPWFALRNSPWWQLSPQPEGPVSRGGRDFVRQEDPVAGLVREVHRLVRVNPEFRERAIEKLTAPLTGHVSLHETLTSLFTLRPALPRADDDPESKPLDRGPEPVDVSASGSYLVGREYDREYLHETARRDGLPPGNRYSGITVVGDHLCVFWNPFKRLYANRWISEPREFTYSGEGSNGDQTETGGNLRLIERENSGEPVLLFVKNRREGSSWVHMGAYRVIQHTWGSSRGDDGVLRRELEFRFELVARGTRPKPVPIPVPPPVVPDLPSERELWEAIQRGGSAGGERRRGTKTHADKRLSDPLKTDYVRQRAMEFGGACELCDRSPEWVGDDRRPHFQAHHIDADIDLVDWIAALCGTCHDRMHHSTDRLWIAETLLLKIQDRQRDRGRQTATREEVDQHDPVDMSVPEAISL